MELTLNGERGGALTFAELVANSNRVLASISRRSRDNDQRVLTFVDHRFYDKVLTV